MESDFRPMNSFNIDGEVYHAPPGYCYSPDGRLVDLIRQPMVANQSPEMTAHRELVKNYQDELHFARTALSRRGENLQLAA